MEIRFYLEDVKFYLLRLFSNIAIIKHDFYQKIRFNKLFYRKYESKTKISILSFAVINVCNAKCTFCAYRLKDKNSKLGVMSFEIFKKGLDEFVHNGGKKISFTPVVGETLLDHNIIQKINYAVKTNTLNMISMTTNGILLDHNELYKKLIDSGMNEIIISFPGFNDENYTKVYGVNKYKEVLSGIHKLLKYNKEKKNKVTIIIGLRTPYLPSEILKSPDYKKYVKPFIGKNIFLSYTPWFDNWGGMIHQRDLSGVMKLRRKRKYNKFPCRLTFDSASIMFNGDVRLCACRMAKSEFDELIVGNILKENLINLHQNNQAKRIRSSFTKLSPPIVCRDCSFYTPVSKKILIKNILRE